MKERTLVLIKPEGVQTHKIGKILSRFEDAGLKIIGMKMAKADVKLVSQHYPESMAEPIWKKAKESFEKDGKEFNETIEYGKSRVRELREHLTESPIVAIVLEGPHAIKCVRKIVGFTSADRAESGTIRGDFSTDSFELGNQLSRPVRNLIHASDQENAEREIKLWFKSSELFEWDSPIQKILYRYK